MPAMHFHLRWPDQTEMRCYSPSLVIKDHFTPGSAYPLPVFMDEVTTALNIASERVREKFGFACSMALDQLTAIEQKASAFDPAAQVHVTAFEE
jgi:uncharacterized repeat protein (TIGR04042 family)